jgi:glycosyltransferase involved in cell wall biosynthesis
MKDKYYLYVGNAYPHKNVETLIRATEIAKVPVLYVGKDDYFYKRLGIIPKSVTDAQLTDLYTHAAALVSPSFMEGFALPPLEALRVGCPVIASDIPVFHELLGDAVTYFNPHDSQALAKLLSTGVPKPKKLTKTFSWSTMARETLGIYTKIFEDRE